MEAFPSEFRSLSETNQRSLWAISRNVFSRHAIGTHSRRCLGLEELERFSYHSGTAVVLFTKWRLVSLELEFRMKRHITS